MSLMSRLIARVLGLPMRPEWLLSGAVTEPMPENPLPEIRNAWRQAQFQERLKLWFIQEGDAEQDRVTRRMLLVRDGDVRAYWRSVARRRRYAKNVLALRKAGGR